MRKVALKEERYYPPVKWTLAPAVRPQLFHYQIAAVGKKCLLPPVPPTSRLRIKRRRKRRQRYRIMAVKLKMMMMMMKPIELFQSSSSSF